MYLVMNMTGAAEAQVPGLIQQKCEEFVGGCSADVVNCTVGRDWWANRVNGWLFLTDWWDVYHVVQSNCGDPGAFITVFPEVAPEEGQAAADGKSCGNPYASSCTTLAGPGRGKDVENQRDCFELEWEVGWVGGKWGGGELPSGTQRYCLD